MSVRKRLILAVLAALAAVALMAAYAADVRGHTVDQRAEALARYGGETATVLVASRDIAAGEVFSERNVTSAEWLVDLLPEGALTDAGTLAGRTSAAAISRNTPLTMQFVDEGARSLDVPAGTVAVSVPCSVDAAVGGAISPNSIVDIFIVIEGTARLLSHGVQVLQVGAGIASSGQSWATIAVEPDEVAAVIAAASLQRLYFVLPAADALETLGERAAQDIEGRSADGSVPAVGEDAAGPDGE